MTTETPVPDKVMKLLAALRNLAENKAATENEINVATTKMQKLLTDYNLSLADIKLGDDGKKHVQVTEKNHTLLYGFNPYWKVDKKADDQRVLTRSEREWRVDMAVAIARTNWCEILSGGSFYSVWFVGTEANIAACQVMWEYVCDQIHRLSYSAMDAYKKGGGYENGRSWRLNYCHGLMTGVSSELYAAFNDSKASADTMALVVVHNTDIREYLDEKNKDRKKPPKPFSTKDRYGPGWNAGYEDRTKVDTATSRRLK